MPALLSSDIFQLGMTPTSELTPRQALGLKIRDAREALGLSRLNVAQEVGCTPETIRNIELGSTTPTAVRLVRICKAVGLEVTLEELAAAS